MTCFRARDADLRQDGGVQEPFRHTGSLRPEASRRYAADANIIIQKQRRNFKLS
jgi:hypothetical protein